MRKLSRGVVGALVTSVALVASGATASAAAREYDTAKKGTPPASGIHFCAASPNNGAAGCFYVDGEYFWILDLEADGWSPQIDWSSSSGRGGECNHYLSADNWGYCNKSFAETTKVTFRVCNTKRDGSYSCGAYTTVRAGGY